MLVAVEFAARIDLPDLLGSMICGISRKSGLASGSDGWWCIGAEIFSHLHLCLGINAVTAPSNVDCAKSMYQMLMALDCAFMAKRIVDAVAERVFEQASLYGTDENLKLLGRLYS